jgi:hypothetical protein
MKPPFPVVAPLLLAGSALAFAASAYVYADWNLEPWTLPVSGDGITVRTPFSLATSGTFHVRLSVPTTSQSVDSQEPHWSGSPCLIMQTDAEDAPGTPAMLRTFRAAGLYVYGGLAYYESEDVVRIAAGSHTVSLRTCQPGVANQFFVSLERAGEPTGQFVSALLVRGLGWLLLVVGIAATALTHLRWARAKRMTSSLR